MCGRYELVDGEWTRQHPVTPNKGYKFEPNYNVAPTQKMPVLIKGDEGYKLKEMKWGIHRQIGKDKEKDIINTRSNKALGRFWGKTVRENRCLIPASGFYEWNVNDGSKTPFLIYPKNKMTFMFAGIYNPEHQTYSIMTTEPNKEMSSIHNRMPVIILDKKTEEAWMGVEEDDEIEQLLLPLKDGSLNMHEVSREVNKVSNNYQTLLEPVSS